jgi:hypothetical protein
MSQLDGLYHGPDTLLHHAAISILSRGPCKDDSVFQTDDMSVAVSPNSDFGTHNRPSLRTEPPLPWSDFYHPTVNATFPVVRIRTRLLPCSKLWQLDQEGVDRSGSYEYEDEDRRAVLAAGRLGERPTVNGVLQPGSGLPVGLAPPRWLPPSHDERLENKEAAAECVYGEYDVVLSIGTNDKVQTDQSMTDVMETIFASAAENDELYPYSAIVDPMTYDLESVIMDNIGSPLDFLAEMEELQRSAPLLNIVTI